LFHIFKCLLRCGREGKGTKGINERKEGEMGKEYKRKEKKKMKVQKNKGKEKIG
jgi:hypothetical protein